MHQRMRTTVRSVTTDRSAEPFALLTTAVLDRLGQMTADELLRFITDRDLQQETGVSAGTVRRAFAREPGSERIDRGRILVAVVEQILDETDDVHRENAARWLDAARQLDEGAGPEALLAAVADDIGSFTPAHDPELDRRERGFLLALAMADGDDAPGRTVAQLLRRHFERYDDQYGAAYRAILAATDRRLADGIELRQLQHAVYAVLSYFNDMARIGIHVPPEDVLEVLLPVWSSFTRRAGDPRPDPNPADEVLDGIAANRGSAAG